VRSPRAKAGAAAAPLAALAATVAAFACVGAIDPNEPGRYPPCPVLALTGLHCPGCGGLRSAYAVAHGDLGAALGSNALAVAGFALWGVTLVSWLLRSDRWAWTWRPPPDRPARAVILLLAALVTAFTVLRNLPAGAALAPS
jgi:hypothetical protein